MLLKLIRCEVDAARREAFAEGQACWRALAGQPNFAGQTGGWQKNIAWLSARWADWDGYAAFRRSSHDALFARSGQGLAIDRIEVSYWESVADEQVDRRGSPDTQGAATLAQLELLELAPGCLPEFREFLTWRWRAQLAGAPGLHTASLYRHRKQPGRYLIWSDWAENGRPLSLAGLLQPGYRVPQRRLRLLRRHEVIRIPLESSWTVAPASPQDTDPQPDRL